jgi:hypothetical protein
LENYSNLNSHLFCFHGRTSNIFVIFILHYHLTNEQKIKCDFPLSGCLPFTHLAHSRRKSTNENLKGIKMQGITILLEIHRATFIILQLIYAAIFYSKFRSFASPCHGFYLVLIINFTWNELMVGRTTRWNSLKNLLSKKANFHTLHGQAAILVSPT